MRRIADTANFFTGFQIIKLTIPVVRIATNAFSVYASVIIRINRGEAKAVKRGQVAGILVFIK